MQCLHINNTEHTCISFFTTSRPRIWSNIAYKNLSVIIDNLNLSLCHNNTLESSTAVTDTYKIFESNVNVIVFTE